MGSILMANHVNHNHVNSTPLPTPTLSVPPGLHLTTPTLSTRSRHSFSLRDVGLSVTASRAALRVDRQLHLLGLISVLSTFIAAIAVLLIFQLIQKQEQASTLASTLWVSRAAYDGLVDAGLGVATLVAVLDLCSVIVCVTQCYLSSRLSSSLHGEEKVYKLLKKSVGTRFIATASFFVSIPLLFVAIGLFMVLQTRSFPSILGLCILGAGLLFVSFVVVMSCYTWDRETGASKYGSYTLDAGGNKRLDSQSSELSTLV
ncbi:Hypp1346 [Branchiostoma lanceolatum]|uniref:Hypp1346 protein n=1 Tax=Branchiostoma lanceolatum TaxID=7740 RepID=A0A8J9ZJ43_BRALA|nr:Hypp1346 [Branchiostoma lanceolatum]